MTKCLVHVTNDHQSILKCMFDICSFNRLKWYYFFLSVSAFQFDQCDRLYGKMCQRSEIRSENVLKLFNVQDGRGERAVIDVQNCEVPDFRIHLSVNNFCKVPFSYISTCHLHGEVQ